MTVRTSPWQRRLLRHPSAWIGATLLSGVILVAVFAGVIAPYQITDRHGQLLPPSWSHPLGTDAFEYDVLTRVLYGARLSLAAGILSVSFALVAGTLCGAVAGYAGGKIDAFLMRTLDIFLAFPSLLIALLMVAAYRPGWPAVILSVALINVPIFARQIRATVLVLRHQEYVAASQALGATHWHILWVAIFPGLISPIVVLATMGLGTAILEVASLSYLGVAGDPSVPEWGSMLKHAKEHLHASLWPAVAPGTAISLTILGCNLLGDALRDAWDPRALPPNS